MITYADSFNTYDLGNYYAIIQPSSEMKFDNYVNSYQSFKSVEQGFSYNSRNNKSFLNVEELRSLIKQNVDHNFEPV